MSSSGRLKCDVIRDWPGGGAGGDVIGDRLPVRAGCENIRDRPGEQLHIVISHGDRGFRRDLKNGEFLRIAVGHRSC